MAPLLLLKGLFDLPKIMGFVKENWKAMAIAGMIGMLVYQNTFEKRYVFFIDTIPYWEKEANLNKEALDKAVKANELLSSTIEARNTEINKWKDVSDKLAADNAKLKGVIGAMRTKTDKDVNDILAGPTPGSCEAAMEYLRQGIGDLKWSE